MLAIFRPIDRKLSASGISGTPPSGSAAGPMPDGTSGSGGASGSPASGAGGGGISSGGGGSSGVPASTKPIVSKWTDYAVM